MEHRPSFDSSPSADQRLKALRSHGLTVCLKAYPDTSRIALRGAHGAKAEAIRTVRCGCRALLNLDSRGRLYLREHKSAGTGQRPVTTQVFYDSCPQHESGNVS